MSESSVKAKKGNDKDQSRSMDEILGPSKEQQAATHYNRKHPEVASEFKSLTGVDPTNYEAVKAWQLAHKLPGDGKIGPATLKAAKAAAPKQHGHGGGEGDGTGEANVSHRAEGEEQAAMDPSVAALFDGTPTTDQEQGTDEHAAKAQAAACRVALQKHLNDFQLASRNGVDIAMQSVRERKG